MEELVDSDSDGEEAEMEDWLVKLGMKETTAETSKGKQQHFVKVSSVVLESVLTPWRSHGEVRGFGPSLEPFGPRGGWKSLRYLGDLVI